MTAAAPMWLCSSEVLVVVPTLHGKSLVQRNDELLNQSTKKPTPNVPASRVSALGVCSSPVRPHRVGVSGSDFSRASSSSSLPSPEPSPPASASRPVAAPSIETVAPPAAPAPAPAGGGVAVGAPGPGPGGGGGGKGAG